MDSVILNAGTISLVELGGLHDPLLFSWLDLYETAFPAEQRILISHLLSELIEHEHNRRMDDHIRAAVNEAGQFTGLISSYEPQHLDVAYLWYLAVQPGDRGRGLGSSIYQGLLRQLHPGVKALIFDMEDPLLVKTSEGQALANRRIQFYRRQGARLLGGIRYVQSIGSHQPPIQLRLAVHPLVDLTPGQACDLAETILGDAITRLGQIFWE